MKGSTNAQSPNVVDLTSSITVDTTKLSAIAIRCIRTGNVVTLSFVGMNILTTVNDTPVISGLPRAKGDAGLCIMDWQQGPTGILFELYNGTDYIRKYGSATAGNIYQSMSYITDEPLVGGGLS